MSNLSILAFDEIPRGTTGRGATERIAQLLDNSEIDAPSSLYDEALALAKEGRFAPATDRLRMVLTLDPIDADASLLLGKVLAARGQWQEALQRLDTAQANGSIVPAPLRDRVEASLRAHVQDAEEYRLRIAARERDEIRNLRTEAKRLRSDNAVLDQQIQALYKRVRLWSSATALVSGCAAALLLVALVSTTPDAIAETDSNLIALEDAELELLASADAITENAARDRQILAATDYSYQLQPARITVVEPTESIAPAPATTADEVITSHTVTDGDTLGKIALDYYGKSSKWELIRDANPTSLSGGIKLRLGMILTIPALDE